MTMLITSAPYVDVVHALKGAAEKMKLDTASVDTWKGVVKLKRGFNIWTWGDIVKVNLLAIHDVQVVHVEAGANIKGDVGPAAYGVHRKLERELVTLMRDRLGKGRCDIIP